MDSVTRPFDTLMTRTYEVRYEPSACVINPFFKVVEHKTRPVLKEVEKRNMYRRSLSEVLNSKAADPVLDRNHSSLNTLHNFEPSLKSKVSLAAPSKEHQQYAALRQGRDPRMNEANAYFDKLRARMDKENQGFNAGRLNGQRPSTATLNWRPKKPFLTFEKACPTTAQEKDFNSKRLRAKVMNDRIQVFNLQSVPDHLLPSRGLAWVKQSEPVKRSRSLPKENTEAAIPLGQPAANQETDKERVEEAGETPKPSKILEKMHQSNIKDIIYNMTVHEQLRMLRNIIEDEEFKRRRKLKQSRETEQAAAASTEPKELRPSEKESVKCTCKLKAIDDMTYSELAEQKPEDAIATSSNPQPLVEHNLSKLNNRDKSQWTVRSEVPSNSSASSPKQVIEKK